MKYIVIITAITLISFLLLVLTIKGKIHDGKLDFQTNYSIETGGPYELSINTGRYALTQAIVDNHSFFLTKDQAKFAAPDVVAYKDRFFSIFTPGIAFLAVPLYIIGKYFGVPQLFSYFLNVIFALLDILVIARLARKFKSGLTVSLLAGLIFIFATNALAFSQSFTQHLVSTFIIIAMLTLAPDYHKKRNVLAIGILYGLGFLADFPNVILGLPIIIYLLAKQLEIKFNGKIELKLRLAVVLFAAGLLPILAVFGYYNSITSGNPLKLAQSIGKTNQFNENQPPAKIAKVPENIYYSNEIKTPLRSFLPFDTRNELNGLYTLIISDERSWIFYSPILLLGIIGLAIASRRRDLTVIATLSIAVVGLDYILYSSFGDPWGGWSFGPRYLIPAAAISSAGIAIVIEKYKSKVLLWPIFLALVYYSTAVNVFGVLTTIAVPPKVEAVALNVPIPYTYENNLNLLKSGLNMSLIYNLFLSKSVKPMAYALYLFTAISIFLSIVTYLGLLETEKKHD